MKNTKDKFKPANAVYTPAQVSTQGVEAIEAMRKAKTRLLSLGIAGIRDYFAPVMPGQVSAVIAQTSQYKSGFLRCVEHNAAQQLKVDGRTEEILVHVSVEECVEEQAYLEFARETGEDAGSLARGEVQDWDKLMQAALRVAGIPIYRIGDSLAHAEDMPNLYMSNMIRSLKFLSEKLLGHRVQVAGLFFDYLQAFPIDPEVRAAIQDQQRRLQVRSDMYRLRQAAAYFECPVFVAVQAKQKLDGAPGRTSCSRESTMARSHPASPSGAIGLSNFGCQSKHIRSAPRSSTKTSSSKWTRTCSGSKSVNDAGVYRLGEHGSAASTSRRVRSRRSSIPRPDPRLPVHPL